jgi:hypothetical protein
MIEDAKTKGKKKKEKKGFMDIVTWLSFVSWYVKKILIDWLIDWRKQEYRMMLFPRFFPTIFLAISPEIIILFLVSATRLRSGMVLHEISESLLLILVKAFYV